MNKLLMLLLACFCYSCRKAIELDLRESDIKYVVEGVITNEPGGCKVYLSRSKPFYENNQFEVVSGATVKLVDNGNEVLLVESIPGEYQNSAITGVPGHVYQLIVTINNEVFTAQCTMPQAVQLDSLYISPGPLGQFKFATITYTDPISTNNNYRFIQYLNGLKDPAIFWENDEFTNGRPAVLQLDTGIDKKDDPRSIKTGDKVTVEMLCVDESVYKYWYSLRSGGGEGSGSTAAPANPVTNIKGGALGYFSAHTLDRKTVIAP